MKVLIVDTYYSGFLNNFYALRPNLATQSYAKQWRTLMEQYFGTADFYSSNLKLLGHEATEIVANCEPLQRQWTKEQGIKLNHTKWVIRLRKGYIPWPYRIQEWFYPILIAQLKYYRPDVLHIQNMAGTSSAFLREIRPYVRLITGQIASPIPPQADFSEYDLVLSSFPHFVEQFQHDGLTSQYFNLGYPGSPVRLIRPDVEDLRIAWL